MKQLIKLLHPKFQKLILDYPVVFKPRYGHGLSPNALLQNIISQTDAAYFESLNKCLDYVSVFQEWSLEKENESRPFWNNKFLPGLDMVSLYTLLASKKPKRYLEIGSGNSTKVAHEAKLKENLTTEIISVDPFPRAEIDNLANVVIREPFENTSLSIAEKLEAGDFLFIDNSHRVLPNSDATVFFMEVLPDLKKGVIVQIHDIYLPYDYPQFMCDRFYSEQYTLAAFILANPNKFKTILPNYYLSQHKDYGQFENAFWQQLPRRIERHGGSYWIEISE
ncbi:MAG: class I SAM-dependent methyltransferase [Bacteroidetes bacterium]|nr:class I SAM-dependent methyltransferase [Bacteroidota bacterium]